MIYILSEEDLRYFKDIIISFAIIYNTKFKCANGPLLHMLECGLATL